MIQYVLVSLFTGKQQLKTMKQATRKPTTPGDILLYEYLEPLDLKINELAELLHVHRNKAFMPHPAGMRRCQMRHPKAAHPQ